MSLENQYKKQRLILLRDSWFDKYVDVYEKIIKWENDYDIMSICVEKNRKQQGRHLVKMMREHLKEISQELVKLDEQICATKDNRDLFTELNELY